MTESQRLLGRMQGDDCRQSCRQTVDGRPNHGISFVVQRRIDYTQQTIREVCVCKQNGPNLFDFTTANLGWKISQPFWRYNRTQLACVPTETSDQGSVKQYALHFRALPASSIFTEKSDSRQHNKRSNKSITTFISRRISSLSQQIHGSQHGRIGTQLLV